MMGYILVSFVVSQSQNKTMCDAETKYLNNNLLPSYRTDSFISNVQQHISIWEMHRDVQKSAETYEFE